MHFYKKYINCEDEDGNPYIEETGSGRHLAEIVKQQAPAVEFNDVKNGPSFIVK